MLIVGAKGFAKEVLEIQYQLKDIDNLVFFDNVSDNIPSHLYNKFSILKTFNDVSHYFSSIDKRFTIGIGNPLLRMQLYKTFVDLGGEYTSTISPKSSIGHFNVQIGEGSNILDQVILSNNVSIGRGSLIYFNSIVTHDVTIGNFVEISPCVSLLGRVTIGDYSQIGSHATILPDVVLGQNVIVGAGAVVTKDVSSNSMVVGMPARVKKELKPLRF